MSWFTVTTLDPFVGATTVPGAERAWGFCRVRLDYDGGGHTVAVVPMWLRGLLSMGAHPSRSAGKAWHRHWRAGEAAGWVVVDVDASETAAQRRARELREAEQPLDLAEWTRSFFGLPAQEASP